MRTVFYHNHRCSKSREALALLREQGVEPEIIDYMEHPPTHEELQSVLDKLGMVAVEIMRTNEPEYAELGLLNARYTEDGLIDMMIAHPGLIQRPIVVCEDVAVVARPAERVLELPCVPEGHRHHVTRGSTERGR